MDNSNESVENIINDYYKLKNKYQTEIMKNKKKIMNNPSLSAKEKRSEFIKLKPKCINCKRPGGTLFSTKFYPQKNKTPDNQEDDYRELTAKCGILADPCNLDIKIRLGKCELLPDILQEIEKEIKDNKKDIIESKNKLLFGYISTNDALQSYENIKDYVSHFTSLLEQYLSMYIDITDNLQTKEILNQDIERSYMVIDEIKQCVVNFNELATPQYIRDAVTIYINTLLPLLSKISTMKYKEKFVHYNEDLNSYHLIEKKYTIESLEYTSTPNTVVRYNIGLKVTKGKKPLIIDSSESVDTETSPNMDITIQGDGTIPPDQGIYNGDRITWTNNKYQDLWNSLPDKFKLALMNNKEWMDTFMYNCVNARAKKENCLFTTPKNLIIPPELLENGNYNFGQGNEVYANLFSNFDKSYQNTLLSLYSENNGIKNFSMFVDTLNKLLAKELGFEKGYF